MKRLVKITIANREHKNFNMNARLYAHTHTHQSKIVYGIQPYHGMQITHRIRKKLQYARGEIANNNECCESNSNQIFTIVSNDHKLKIVCCWFSVCFGTQSDYFMYLSLFAYKV